MRNVQSQMGKTHILKKLTFKQQSIMDFKSLEKV
jgi:hypothetical protein